MVWGFQLFTASGQTRLTTGVLARTASLFLLPLPPWLPVPSSDRQTLSSETLLRSFRAPSGLGPLLGCVLEQSRHSSFLIPLPLWAAFPLLREFQSVADTFRGVCLSHCLGVAPSINASRFSRPARLLCIPRLGH